MMAGMSLRRVLPFVFLAVSAGGAACASEQSASVSEADQTRTSSVVLDIPTRIQWPNDGGYCGETSIQSIGLYYGAWISQAVARDVAGGEVLLGDNEEDALDRLHFSYDVWKGKKDHDQFEAFSVWLKGHLADRHPTIFTVYLSDANDDPDYDHIMPAIGIDWRHRDRYDGDDVLTFHNNFGSQLRRSFKSLGASRKKCDSDSAEGGCIPKDVDYGTAILGFEDEDGVTLPTRLTVERNSEPNVSRGERPVALRGTVHVSKLSSGKAYALLRYDDVDAVPEKGSAEDYLSSRYDARVDFVADGETWVHADPDPFASDGVRYYRCVAR